MNKDKMSNADRQKRYRDKKRNAPVTPERNVTQTNMDTVTLRNGSQIAGISIEDISDDAIERQLTSSMLNSDIEQARELIDSTAVILDQTATLDHYHSNPDLYATRTEPDRLNWGGWMDVGQLKAAGLRANRVAVPGDWDYVGVCVEVDGVWKAV